MRYVSSFFRVLQVTLATVVLAGTAQAEGAQASAPEAAATESTEQAGETAAEPSGPFKSILVNTDRQKLFAWEDNKLVFEFDVVTGRPGKETHPGRFYTTRKYKDYTSMTYKVEMPYTMFFTEDGKAIHGTKWATLRSYVHAYINESVGSQGCVGLTEEDAKALFEWAPLGTRIDIIEEEPED